MTINPLPKLQTIRSRCYDVLYTQTAHANTHTSILGRKINKIKDTDWRGNSSMQNQKQAKALTPNDQTNHRCELYLQYFSLLHFFYLLSYSYLYRKGRMEDMSWLSPTEETSIRPPSPPTNTALLSQQQQDWKKNRNNYNTKYKIKAHQKGERIKQNHKEVDRHTIWAYILFSILTLLEIQHVIKRKTLLFIYLRFLFSWLFLLISSLSIFEVLLLVNTTCGSD